MSNAGCQLARHSCSGFVIAPHMPHVIRLREPWQSTDAGKRRIAAAVQLPDGPAAGDRVWLVVEGLASVSTVRSTAISVDATSDATGTLAREIQSHLDPHNEVVIRVDGRRPSWQPTSDSRNSDAMYWPPA